MIGDYMAPTPPMVVEMTGSLGLLRYERIVQTLTWEDAPYEDWGETDSRGHRHAFTKPAVTGDAVWRGKGHKPPRALMRETTNYPTLRFVITRWHHCSGRETMYSHDPHDHIDDGHYECRECGERIEPGHGPGSTMIPVSESATLDGQLISRERAQEVLNLYWQEREAAKRTEDERLVLGQLGYPQGFGDW